MPDFFSVYNLNMSFDGNSIIDDLCFKIESGTINAILSPNEGGKTTLINILSGILKCDSGSIILQNIKLTKRNFKKYKINVGTVFEDLEHQFIEELVYDELAFPLIYLNYNKKNINKRINEISSVVNIRKLLDRKISTLSHFDKIKVCIAASIIHMPKILFLDDIFRTLTSSQKKEINSILKDLKENYRLTIIFTTSFVEDIIDCDNILVLDNGKIVMSGTYDKLIMKDNELSKMGLEIPVMIDLSRKLEFYDLIDQIYYSPDKVVDELWK